MASGSRRRGRVLIYVALILILGLILVWAIFLRPGGGTSIGGQAAPTAAPAEEMVNIVVISQKVSRGMPLTENELTTIPYPKSNIEPGTFFTDIKEVVGKRAKVDLEPKTPVTTGLIAAETPGSAAAFQIPKGMVAVSIPINRLSSVSYAPQAGDFVNILVSMMFVDLDTNFQTLLPNNTAVVIAPGAGQTGNTVTASVTNPQSPAVPMGRGELESSLNQPIYVYPSEGQRPRIVTQTLLQDILVIQVGNFLLPGETPVSQTAPQPTPTPGPNGETTAPVATKPTAPDVITVVVTPQDAVTLNYLVFQRSLDRDNLGRLPVSGAELTLVLRGPGDDSRVQTEAVTLQYLMDQYNIPVPAKLPYGLEPAPRYLTAPWLEQDLSSLLAPK